MGIWGTLAVGIFGVDKSFSAQLIGTLAAGALAFPFAMITFMGIKATMGLRVSEKEEFVDWISKSTAWNLMLVSRFSLCSRQLTRVGEQNEIDYCLYST